MILPIFLSLLLPLAALAEPAKKERWVYLPTNFQVTERADQVIALLDRAATAGYTHALIADSKFARLHKKLKVAPFRHYHVSVRIRSEGLAGGTPEIKAIGKDGRQLQWTNLKVPADQDWTRHDVTFNSLDSDEVALYLGVWGGHRGTLWWDDATVTECGPVNLLRRPGAPLVIKKADGTLLAEGKDYGPVTNPDTGSKPWKGEFTTWRSDYSKLEEVAAILGKAGW